MQITGLDTRVTSLETKVTGLETKITSLETKVTGLETKVTGLETKVGEIKEDLAVARVQLTNSRLSASDRPMKLPLPVGTQEPEQPSCLAQIMVSTAPVTSTFMSENPLIQASKVPHVTL